MIFITANVVVLGGLAWVLAPRSANDAPAPDKTVHAAFVVRQAKRVSGPPVIRTQTGAHLQIEVESDRDDELHLHGYDRSWPLSAGELASASLVLDRAGRFALELHHADIELTTLEVQPQ
ncbi:hypothetical protein T5B8_06748 [Salinisphaera sp. T5B8]|uniref:hypothetical protein n=1 Tax=Salinisphaera sp. S4-8 TaxID=633357 RepID=UPI003340A542